MKSKKKEKKEDWNFEFVVCDITKENAEWILSVIKWVVEVCEAIMAGGFHRYDDEVGKRE